MKQKAITIRFMTSLLIAVCLIFSLTPPIPALAEGTRTVRVGYYENEIFQEGAREGAVKSGFGYEYYRKLAEYTGWKYDYVYGSWRQSIGRWHSRHWEDEVRKAVEFYQNL